MTRLCLPFILCLLSGTAWAQLSAEWSSSHDYWGVVVDADDLPGGPGTGFDVVKYSESSGFRISLTVTHEDGWIFIFPVSGEILCRWSPPDWKIEVSRHDVGEGPWDPDLELGVRIANGSFEPVPATLFGEGCGEFQLEYRLSVDGEVIEEGPYDSLVELAFQED